MVVVLEFTPRTRLRGMSADKGLGIAEMAELTGLSADTLRWYEREGILPAVSRSTSGHRSYTAQERELVLLLTSLRDTGMTTAMMKSFVGLVMEGASSHGRRIELLEQARQLLGERRRKLDRSAAAIDSKISHYEELIRSGLDCVGAPVTNEVRTLQAARF